MYKSTFINYDISHSFDEVFEAKAIFLDISNALDKVWSEGLIYKLRQHGFSGDFLSLLINFLTSRKQRLVLNDQNSSWADIKVGVPLGFILGPLFFLLHVNDLTENLRLKSKAFYR